MFPRGLSAVGHVLLVLSSPSTLGKTRWVLSAETQTRTCFGLDLIKLQSAVSVQSKI